MRAGDMRLFEGNRAGYLLIHTPHTFAPEAKVSLVYIPIVVDDSAFKLRTTSYFPHSSLTSWDSARCLLPYPRQPLSLELASPFLLSEQHHHLTTLTSGMLTALAESLDERAMCVSISHHSRIILAPFLFCCHYRDQTHCFCKFETLNREG